MNFCGKVEELKKSGVIFIDEKSVYIEDNVKIGKGTTIEPNVYLRGETIIGENCVIGFCSDISDSIIKDNVTIKHSVITKSTIGKGTNR